MGVVLSMVIAATTAESDLWEEDDDKEAVLVRTVRGTKERGNEIH